MVVTNKAEKERFSVFRLYMFAERRLTLLDPTSVVLSGVFGVSGGWAEKVIWAGRAVFAYIFGLRVEKVVFSWRKLLDFGSAKRTCAEAPKATEHRSAKAPEAP